MSQTINNESIIAVLRQYFMGCPYLRDGEFNIDYLPDSRSYSLDPIPSEPVYKEYVDGGKIYQFQYSFTSKEAYDGDARTMIDNSFFYQNLADWIERQDDEGLLPGLEGRQAISNTLMSSYYLFGSDADLAKYQVQLRLLYE